MHARLLPSVNACRGYNRHPRIVLPTHTPHWCSRSRGYALQCSTSDLLVNEQPVSGSEVPWENYCVFSFSETRTIGNRSKFSMNTLLDSYKSLPRNIQIGYEYICRDFKVAGFVYDHISFALFSWDLTKKKRIFMVLIVLVGC